jgi:hypothetical protein
VVNPVMRSVWAAFLCAALAACGGSTESDSHGTGGGGAPSGGGTTASGGTTSSGGTTASGGTQNLGGGGTGVGGGNCFPGSKVCPNASGQLVCLTSIQPETGCDSTGCDPCAVPHAGAVCDSAGQCAVGTCEAGWADCNGDSADGCEVSLDNSLQHCGNCATDCFAEHGPNWACVAGQCEIVCAGPPNLFDCDGDPANGCEVDALTDPMNCGFCGNVCQFGPCINGSCATP